MFGSVSQTLTPSRMLKTFEFNVAIKAASCLMVKLQLKKDLTSLDVRDLFPKKKRHSLFIIIFHYFI